MDATVYDAGGHHGAIVTNRITCNVVDGDPVLRVNDNPRFHTPVYVSQFKSTTPMSYKK